jgi:hypothetical protein
MAAKLSIKMTLPKKNHIHIYKGPHGVLMDDCVNDCEIDVTCGLLPNHTFEEQNSNPLWNLFSKWMGGKNFHLQQM